MNKCAVFSEIRHLAAYAILPLYFFLLVVLLPVDLHALVSGDEVLQQIGVDEKLDAAIPLELVFTDQNGGRVRLGDYFTGEPVILTLNFYECPMLCPLIFRSLIDTMAKIQGLSLDRDFRIITVSFNPDETPARTKERALETHRMLQGIAGAEQRWPFLMGDAAAIEQLTRTVGFRYVRLAKDNFAHPSVLILATPDGKVARYLYGVNQSPRDLKLALIEAADGRIGGSQLINRALMYCFQYDPAGKKYALAAVNIMKITGVFVLFILGILLVSLWRREKRGADGKRGG